MFNRSLVSISLPSLFFFFFSPYFSVVVQARAVDLKLGDGWGVAAGGGVKSDAARARDSTNEPDGIEKKKE